MAAVLGVSSSIGSGQSYPAASHRSTMASSSTSSHLADSASDRSIPQRIAGPAGNVPTISLDLAFSHPSRLAMSVAAASEESYSASSRSLCTGSFSQSETRGPQRVAGPGNIGSSYHRSALACGRKHGGVCTYHYIHVFTCPLRWNLEDRDLRHKDRCDRCSNPSFVVRGVGSTNV